MFKIIRIIQGFIHFNNKYKMIWTFINVFIISTCTFVSTTLKVEAKTKQTSKQNSETFECEY